MIGVITRERFRRLPLASSSRLSSRRTESRSKDVLAPSVESDVTPDSSRARRRAIFCAVVSAMPHSLRAWLADENGEYWRRLYHFVATRYRRSNLAWPQAVHFVGRNSTPQ